MEEEEKRVVPSTKGAGVPSSLKRPLQKKGARFLDWQFPNTWPAVGAVAAALLAVIVLAETMLHTAF